MILKSIDDLLQGRPAVCIGPDVTLMRACEAFAQASVGALAVMEGDRLVGILTEGDVVRRAVGRGLRTRDAHVRDVMTADPLTVPATAPVAQALSLMRRGGFRHLPVTRDEALVGLISIRDIPTEYRLMAERFAEYTEDSAL